MDYKMKYEKLKSILKEMGSVIVAFSGGVDSTLLLYAAKNVLQSSAFAATAVSYVYPSWETREAIDFAKSIGIEHIIIKYDPLKDVEGFKNNPKNRCYLCKKNLFSKLVETAKQKGIKYAADGTNMDDTGDYRPGLIAVKELGIRSPLLEAGLTKKEIRQISYDLGLKTYSKPSFACLATRIPTDNEITKEKLERIDKSEIYILSKGIKNVRVRCHEDIARIEVDKNEINKFFNTDIINDIDKKLKEYGFKFVCLDFSGYKTGSMNIGVDIK